MMKLKYSIAVTLITLLILLFGGSLADTHIFPAEPMTPTQNSISKEDAITIAKNEMEKRENVALGDFQNYKIKANDVKLENGEEAWVVMLDCQFYGTDALVTISAANATIIDYQATDQEILSAVVNQWIEKKGAMGTWSVEDKALFDFLYGSSDEYVVPRQDDISQEAAGIIALSAIPQTSSSLELSYSFKMLSYTDGRPDEYAWLVTVLEHGQEKYVVHISASDGKVIEVFMVSNSG